MLDLMAVMARWRLYQGVRGGRCVEVVIVGGLRGVFSEAECIIYLFLVSFTWSFDLPIFFVDIFSKLLYELLKGVCCATVIARPPL